MMILFFFLLNTGTDAKIDSLRTLLNQHPRLPVVLELNKYYLRVAKFNEGIDLLGRYEKYLKSDEKPFLIFSMGDNYLFAGKILEARDEYLKLVSRYPNSEVANDALERLYLIENTRQDTLLLKKLTHSICLYETEELHTAEDSLRNLLKTNIGAYAYYYLALLYEKKEDLPMALSALKELNKSFPGHKIHNAILVLAKIYLKMNDKKEAQDILEDLIVKKPTSIYAVHARKILEEHIFNKKE